MILVCVWAASERGRKRGEMDEEVTSTPRDVRWTKGRRNVAVNEMPCKHIDRGNCANVTYSISKCSCTDNIVLVYVQGNMFPTLLREIRLDAMRRVECRMRVY